jgi:hypothetical protein
MIEHLDREIPLICFDLFVYRPLWQVPSVESSTAPQYD